MNEALGWSLFHFLWEGAAIALALAIFILATRSARARYAASCLAMLTMLAAFAVTVAWKLPQTVVPSSGAVHIPAGVLRPAPDAPGSVFGPASLPYGWAVPVWLAGVALLSLHRLLAFAAAHRMRNVGVTAAQAPWPERLEQLASQLGIMRPVLLLESCLAEVPAAAGYLRPAILMPAGLLAGLPADQVEFILIHELAHIARRDYLVNLLQSVVEALLFYHPAVWWVSSVIRNEREHCCDDVVVAVAGDPRRYAETLVTLEQGRVPRPALAANGGSLTRRVRRLLRQPASSPNLASPLAAAAIVALIAGITLAAGQPEQIVPPNVPLAHPPAATLVAQSSAAQEPRRSSLAQRDETPLDGPYRKWLTEDAAYIITDAERASFKQLATNQEREQFIDQFWLRRDPTPGTVENEFKEEHYRRIAYSNEHFASYVPGWKTDRGRVYITYGPPDELEDHPAGGAYQRPAPDGGLTTTGVPFQQWRYKFIEAVGDNVIVEFVDPAKNGEYRMTSDPREKEAINPGSASPGLLTDRARLAELLKTYTDRHPAIVELRRKIAAAEGINHFVANEPGGKTSVSVNGHSASVLVPLPASGTFEITGAVTDQGGRTAASLRDRISRQPLLDPYAATFTLAPGAYTLKIQVRNTATGEVSNESVLFYVNQ